MNAANEVSVKEFYSPRQIYAGSIVGGPIASLVYLSKNFSLMGKTHLVLPTRIVGLVFTVVVFVAVFFLPKNFPNFVIPAVYALLAQLIAEKHQVSKEEITSTDEYSFKSNWNVAAISVISLFVTILAIFSVILLLPSGIIG